MPAQRAGVDAGIWSGPATGDIVEAQYQRLVALGVAIEVELRSEPWGDRRFVVLDPNGVPIDVVQHVGIAG